MSKVKKRILAAVLTVIFLGGAGGGVWYFLRQHRESQTVGVVPVAQIMDYYWGSETSAEGQIVSEHVQELYPDATQVVSQVFVTEGQQVHVGDPLVQYDRDSLQLDVDYKQLAVQQAELNLTNAQRELRKLQNTTPAPEATPEPPDIPLPTPEPTPTPPAAILYDRLDLDSIPYQGSGTAQDPYVYLCTADCVVTPEFMLWLAGGPTPAPEDSPAPSDSPDPADPPSPQPEPPEDISPSPSPTPEEAPDDPAPTEEPGEAPEAGEDTPDPSDEPTDAPTEVPEEDAPAPFSAILEVREGDQVTGALLSAFRINTPLTGEDPGDIEELEDPGTLGGISPDAGIAPASSEGAEVPVGSASDPSKESGNYNHMGYTAAELKHLIAQQEQQIKELSLAQRQAQLDLESAKKTLSHSTVLSTVEGSVRTLLAVDEAISQNSPFLVVAGDSVYYVKGALSESLLGLVQVGDPVTVMDYWSGNQYTAQITDIADYPVENTDYYYGGGNPNSSAYAFTALISDPEGLNVGQNSYVQVTFNVQEETSADALYIAKAYIREDTGGYYVMKVSPENRLTKQYVRTGRTLYGYSMEVKSGLTAEDYLAFPYSRDATEGARAVLEESGEPPYGGGSPGDDDSFSDPTFGGATDIGVVPEGEIDGAAGELEEDPAAGEYTDDFETGDDLGGAEEVPVQPETKGVPVG